MAAGAAEPATKRLKADPLSKLRTPCYVLDAKVAQANATRMLETAKRLGCRLRPHVKTHKTLEGGEIQTGGTKRCIAVSTLAEARFFAEGGFDDIMYTLPITGDKLEEAAALTRRLEAFHITVDHSSQVDDLLAQPAPAEDKKWSVVIMVDCGYHRDGVDPDDISSVDLARRIWDAPACTLKGVYTHGGHSYGANGDVQRVIKIGEAERDAVVSLAANLRKAGMHFEMTGIGSTPTCSNPPANLDGVTEMHPGNYYYYDQMQANLGSCRIQDVAVRVCTRVIGTYRGKNKLLVDLGWTGASAQGKEQGFGAIDGHADLRIVEMSQESGQVTSKDGSPIDFDKYPVGFIFRIIPWHACAATHQHTRVHVLEDGVPVRCLEQVRGW